MDYITIIMIILILFLNLLTHDQLRRNIRDLKDRVIELEKIVKYGR
jgi:hypothetical protein